MAFLRAPLQRLGDLEAALGRYPMPAHTDGPSTKQFKPLTLRGNVELSRLSEPRVSRIMGRGARHAATGECIAWGIPFRVRKALLAKDKPITV